MDGGRGAGISNGPGRTVRSPNVEWALLYFDGETGAYRLHRSERDQALGIRAYFPAIMEVTKCHQDVQVDATGQNNLAAYTAKYAPKFSDSFREDLLNDDADANSVAAAVLSRYHPGIPEMALQLFGTMFRPW